MKILFFLPLLITNVVWAATSSYLEGLNRTFDEIEMEMVDFYVSMPETEVNNLIKLSQVSSVSINSAKDFKYENTTIVIKYNGKEEVYENTSFRTGGNYARQYDKVGFNIKLEKKFLGRKTIRLRPDAIDRTLIRSKLCCDLGNRLGLPSIQASYARLYINGEYWGLYVLMEAIKPSWIKQTFKPSSKEVTTLFQCKNVNMNLQPGSDKICVNANDDIQNDISALTEFVNEINKCTTTEEVEKILDVDVFLKYMIMEWLIGSFDHLLVKGHNFYFYQREIDNKWLIIEHDYDNTFGVGVKASYWDKKGPNQDGTSKVGNETTTTEKVSKRDLDETVEKANDTTNTGNNNGNNNGFNWGNFNGNFNGGNFNGGNFNGGNFNGGNFNGGNFNGGNFNGGNFNGGNFNGGNVNGGNLKSSNNANVVKVDRGDDPVKFTFSDWEFNLPVINVLVHQHKEEFKNRVREVLVSAFNPGLLIPRVEELRGFLIPYIKEDTTPGADGYFPGRINHAGTPRSNSYEEFEQHIETKLKKWINDKFEAACNDYGFDQTEIINESVNVVPKPFDYTSYSLKKDNNEKEEDNKEEKGNQPENKCWSEALGYSCCKSKCKVRVTDESGKWGVEDGQWCGIDDTVCENIKKNAECFGETTGEYECCESCTVWLTDEEGDWGYENKQWCSTKYSCTV